MEVLGESANGKPLAFGASYPGSSPGSPVKEVGYSIATFCLRYLGRLLNGREKGGVY